MKYKVVYIDFEERIEEYESGSEVKIHFFFSDVTIRSNYVNSYKAFRLDNNQEVPLKDYIYHLSVIGDESISFKMPEFDICIKSTRVENNKLGVINVDLSNIKDILYKNSCNGSYVTQALFSDYYDLGFEDCSFDELDLTKFILDAKLKVVLKLIKEENVILLFNNKKYKTTQKNAVEYDKVNVYEYIFEDIDFSKEGTIKFLID